MDYLRCSYVLLTVVLGFLTQNIFISQSYEPFSPLQMGKEKVKIALPLSGHNIPGQKRN